MGSMLIMTVGSWTTPSWEILNLHLSSEWWVHECHSKVMIFIYFTVIFLMKYAITIVHSFVVRLYSLEGVLSCFFHMFEPLSMGTFFWDSVAGFELAWGFWTLVNVNISLSCKQIALLLFTFNKNFFSQLFSCLS